MRRCLNGETMGETMGSPTGSPVGFFQKGISPPEASIRSELDAANAFTTEPGERINTIANWQGLSLYSLVGTV